MKFLTKNKSMELQSYGRVSVNQNTSFNAAAIFSFGLIIIIFWGFICHQDGRASKSIAPVEIDFETGVGARPTLYAVSGMGKKREIVWLRCELRCSASKWKKNHTTMKWQANPFESFLNSVQLVNSHIVSLFHFSPELKYSWMIHRLMNEPSI